MNRRLRPLPNNRVVGLFEPNVAHGVRPEKALKRRTIEEQFHPRSSLFMLDRDSSTDRCHSHFF
jgi:hypothetical protein